MSGNLLFSDSQTPTQVSVGLFTQFLFVLPAEQGEGKPSHSEQLVFGEGRYPEGRNHFRSEHLSISLSPKDRKPKSLPFS